MRRLRLARGHPLLPLLVLLLCMHVGLLQGWCIVVLLHALLLRGKHAGFQRVGRRVLRVLRLLRANTHRPHALAGRRPAPLTRKPLALLQSLLQGLIRQLGLGGVMHVLHMLRMHWLLCMHALALIAGMLLRLLLVWDSLAGGCGELRLGVRSMPGTRCSMLCCCAAVRPLEAASCFALLMMGHSLRIALQNILKAALALRLPSTLRGLRLLAVGALLLVAIHWHRSSGCGLTLHRLLV